MIPKALDKINILVNKINKLDARISKSPISNTTNQKNIKKKDEKRSKIESSDSKHTPVLGKIFIEKEEKEPIDMPK